MTTKNYLINGLKRGCLFYAFSTLLLAGQFMGNLFGNSLMEIMDLEGWAFFIASCVSHASQFALIPFLLFYITWVIRLPKVATGIHIAGVTLLCILNYLDSQVFAIYRFHINGFVLNMVFGEGAGQIFTFSPMLYLKEAFLFLLLTGVVAGLWLASRWIWNKKHKAYAWWVAGVCVGCTLYAHAWHIYASFFQHQSVVKSATLLPYYFPTTAYSFMYDHGFVPPESYHNLGKSIQCSDVKYPLHPLVTEQPDSLPNIVMILVDSWNRRAFTPECMPNAYRFAQQNQWFTNHVSCSNGTRSSVFGIYFGISCYYWESFEPAHIQPLLVERLLDLGYDFRVYPSAQIMNPPFARVLFSKVPNLRVGTDAPTALGRDSTITADFIADMKQQKKQKRPFFSFIFYDGPHSFETSPKQNTHFTPAWAYADYTKLNNSLDPTPFFNLYRNTCYEDDILLGQVFRALEEEGMMENTIVILSGDHSQEFNENKRNYWGHNSNFSIHQIGVPLVCHFPTPGQQTPHKYSHRTTHYDFVPTLMSQYLGVKNPFADYSMGHLLTDSTSSRKWHIVGSNLNYAFIIGGDSILEKTAEGTLDVFDAQMHPVKNYQMPVKQFDEAVKVLNRYFK